MIPSSAVVMGSSAQKDVFQSTDSFKYKALSTSEPEIRLLKLLGRDSSCQGAAYPINCESYHVKVSELPDYKALSYTWDDASDPTHSILINGQDFKVRENLWWGLNRLQPKTGMFMIWIDAICINQDDNQERSQQVRMMKTIFQKARYVCVWLGPAHGNSDWAMKLLKDLCDCAGNEELILDRFKHPEIRRQINALSSLYDRPYWGRIWITQELVLADHIWVICGNDIVSWNAFESIRNSFGKMSSRSELYQLLFKNTDEWSLSNLRDKSKGPNLIDMTRNDFQKRNLGLFESVSGHWPKAASNPRDLIYGLLGIIDEKETKEIEIDYSKSIARVYTDFAKRVILDSG